MDSLSQFALGAACGVAALGRRTAPWKAALWGGVFGTLPDLDVLVDHGDALANMTRHRGDSHALFWLTLVAPAFAALPAWLHGGGFGRWWLAAWLALVTHPLLDAMTVYGTQLLRPFDTTPLGVGSMFIIDPLYTLPLLVGTAVLSGRLRWNTAGLALSTAYLAWSFAAQQHVLGVARASLAAQGIAAERMLVTPAPLNTVLWRVVAVKGDMVHEGFRSLLDREPQMRFDRFDRGAAWWPALAAHPPVQELATFSHGFVKLQRVGDAVHVTDLRMGQEPNHVFSFPIARVAPDGTVTPVPATVNEGRRGDARAGLRWIGQRIVGNPLPPPR